MIGDQADSGRFNTSISRTGRMRGFPGSQDEQGMSSVLFSYLCSIIALGS